MTATAIAAAASTARTRRRTSTGAGVAYVAAWVAGLAAFPGGPAAGAADAEVIAHVTDHRLATALQSVLVHGVAAAALAAVLLAAHRTLRVPAAATAAGLVAVALSASQLLLGLGRSALASGDAIPTIVAAIDRVDGLKLLALAAMVGLALPALRRGRLVGRPMLAIGAGAVATLALAGVGFAGDIDALVGLAAPALVLLLAWVARVGVLADRSA